MLKYHVTVYVLCPRNNSCLLVLSLEGDKLHSLITCGEGMDVLCLLSFCLDPLNNFVLSDYKSQSIRVFSPEGNLLHTIGREGHQLGMFYHPVGVAVTPNGRIVCVLKNVNYALQIFTSLFVCCLFILVNYTTKMNLFVYVFVAKTYD